MSAALEALHDPLWPVFSRLLSSLPNVRRDHTNAGGVEEGKPHLAPIYPQVVAAPPEFDACIRGCGVHPLKEPKTADWVILDLEASPYDGLRRILKPVGGYLIARAESGVARRALLDLFDEPGTKPDQDGPAVRAWTITGLTKAELRFQGWCDEAQEADRAILEKWRNAWIMEVRPFAPEWGLKIEPPEEKTSWWRQLFQRDRM
jgi:hypothetical protein